jgi:hypothetical protein
MAATRLGFIFWTKICRPDKVQGHVVGVSMLLAGTLQLPLREGNNLIAHQTFIRSERNAYLAADTSSFRDMRYLAQRIF